MNDPSVEHMFIVKTGAEAVALSTDPPAPEKFNKKGGVVAIKLTKDQLTVENIAGDLIFFELS
jgi:hypothetical protein